MYFNFLSKRISKFTRYKKHSASWHRKCKAVWCKALAIAFRLHWNINIQVRFSKNPQTFRDKLFIAEGQTETGMGMVSLTVAFHNLERRYKRNTDLQLACKISVIPTATISDIPSLSVRSQQLYTPSIDWHKRFQFGKSCVHIWCWRSVIQNYIEELTGNISQYVTTTSFWHSNLHVLKATEHKVLWWTTVCTKYSSFSLNV